MKRAALKIYLMIFLQLTCFILLFGQQSKPDQAGNKVILFSDRTLYIAGEQILFSAFLQSEAETKQAESSRVLYCEIITPGGTKIAGNKFLINNYSASGYLNIPKDLITGIYYLRAYTRFMRNNGPSYYQYIRIKILNAERNEVQTGTSLDFLSVNLQGGSDIEKIKTPFIISTDKTQYSARDTVHLSIDGDKTSQSSLKGLTLAVVPEFSMNTEIVKISEIDQSSERAFYYPENRGLTITGKLIENTTGNPLQNIRVNLSIIGRGRDFMAMRTDPAGRFFFTLPDYTGYRDIFLCAENKNTSDPKILVDNDFCTVPVRIPANVFTLSKGERETAFNMAVNAQLDSYFKKDSIPSEGENKGDDQIFYGKPDDILYLDDYIQLPTLEDYFNELPTLVKVRKHQGKKYFRITGKQTGLFDFEPLVMVDLVAIDDPGKVLAISPASISRIEVVNNLYVKGDQTYGGIINFISKKRDFAGIDLPSSGIFINYGFFAEKNHDQKFKLPRHTPDTRNTLYWEPQLYLNKNQSAKLSFTTSDTPCRYLIILNGINLQGEEFRQTAVFEVVK